MAQVAPTDPAPALDRPSSTAHLPPSPDSTANRFGPTDPTHASPSCNPLRSSAYQYSTRATFESDFNPSRMATSRPSESAPSAPAPASEHTTSQLSNQFDNLPVPTPPREDHDPARGPRDGLADPDKVLPPSDSISSSDRVPLLPRPEQETEPLSVADIDASFAGMTVTQHLPYGASPQMHMMPLQPQSILPPVPGPHPLPIPAQQRQPHQPPHHHPHTQQQVLQHHPSTHYLWVPQDRVGAVIGGHGAVITSLQDRSGATIQVHNDIVREDQKLFTIGGTFPQYKVAKQLIHDIVEKPRGQSSHGANSSISDRSPYSQTSDVSQRSGELWKKVFVPTSCVGLVIGRNGETIRTLQNRSGADIKVTPDVEATPGAEMRSIHISGTDEAIATAHQLVSEIVMDARSRRPPYNGPQVGATVNGHPIVLEVLSVPNEKVGLIIGKRGAAIRDLQLKSGARVQISKDNSSIQSDGTRPVTITGIRANVDEAKAMIANKINITLQSPSSNVPYNKTQQRSGTAVSSPTGPSQPGPYMVPGVYDPAYPNGQMPFQPVFDPNDPNSQSRANMAYFHFLGYENYAALAQQQRQFQSQMPMHYGHQQHQIPQGKLPGGQQAHQEQQDGGSQSQFAMAGMVPPGEGLHANPGMPSQDASGRVIMYPPHHFSQNPPAYGGQHIFPPGPPNSLMFPRREHMHPAHAQMILNAHVQAQALAQVHPQVEKLQTQAATHAKQDEQEDAQTRQPGPLSPARTTPRDENEQPDD